jgi:hypothetical protein
MESICEYVEYAFAGSSYWVSFQLGGQPVGPLTIKKTGFYKIYQCFRLWERAENI